jgi:hypothetical protein
MLKGIVSAAPTTNWDGLAEAAMESLAGDVAGTLHVIVSAEDFTETERQAALVKFQGCAVRAAANEEDITVSHHEGRLWPCPECETELPVFDHAEMRALRHLDTGGFPTWLHARPPRVKCAVDGVRQVRLPWAEPKSRFTTAFERFAIDVLQETNISGAANMLKTSQKQGVCRGPL